MSQPLETTTSRYCSSYCAGTSRLLAELFRIRSPVVCCEPPGGRVGVVTPCCRDDTSMFTNNLSLPAKLPLPLSSASTPLPSPLCSPLCSMSPGPSLASASWSGVASAPPPLLPSTSPFDSTTAPASAPGPADADASPGAPASVASPLSRRVLPTTKRQQKVRRHRGGSLRWTARRTPRSRIPDLQTAPAAALEFPTTRPAPARPTACGPSVGENHTWCEANAST